MKRLMAILLIALLIPCLSHGQTRPNYLQLTNVPLVYPEYFGAKGDGVTDDAVALQAWVDYIEANNVVGMFQNIYACGSTLIVNQPVTITGVGPKVSGIDFVDDSGGYLYVTKFGSIADLPTVSADVTPLSKNVSFASAHGLAIGDVVAVINTTEYSWNPARAQYTAGELLEVASITSTTAFNAIRLPSDLYEVSGGDIVAREVPMINNVNLSNFGVWGGGPTQLGSALRLYQVRNSLLDNLYVEGANTSAINLEICYKVNISNCEVNQLSVKGGNNYGISIANSEYVTIDKCNAIATRHAVTVGGGTNDAQIVNRRIHTTNSTLETRYDDPAYDNHGNCEFCTLSQSSVMGIEMGGNNNTVADCLIGVSETGATGYALLVAEQIGWNFNILRNTFVFPDASFDGGQNVIIRSNFACQLPVGTGVAKVTEGGTLIIRGNTANYRDTSVTATGSIAINLSVEDYERRDYSILVNDNVVNAPAATLRQAFNLAASSANPAYGPKVLDISGNYFSGGNIATNITGYATKISNNSIIDPEGLGIVVTKEVGTTASKTISIKDNTIVRAGDHPIYYSGQVGSTNNESVIITGNSLLSSTSEPTICLYAENVLFSNNSYVDGTLNVASITFDFAHISKLGGYGNIRDSGSGSDYSVSVVATYGQLDLW